MKKKIFRAIFNVALVVLLASIAIASSFLYDYFNESQVKQLKAELALVERFVNKEGIEYFENFTQSTFRFTVVNPNGVVLYDSQVDPSQMDNHSDREEIIEAFYAKCRRCFFQRYSYERNLGNGLYRRNPHCGYAY